VRESFDSRFGDEDVDSAFNSVECDGVVGGVWGEDCDGVAGGEGIDCSFVGIWVGFGVRRVGDEGGGEVVVELGYVFVKVLSCLYQLAKFNLKKARKRRREGGKRREVGMGIMRRKKRKGDHTNSRILLPTDSNHTQLPHLPPPPQIKQGQSHHSHLFI